MSKAIEIDGLTLPYVVGKIPTTMFVVSRPNGTWEARESFRTDAGPRSRTLATFRELTPEIEARVADRCSKPVSSSEIRVRAARAGAPVFDSEADRAARSLLREMATGRRPRRALLRLLPDDPAGADPSNHASERMKMWVGADKRERAQALEDLLRLGDSLPAGRRAARSEFPRIRSG